MTFDDPTLMAYADNELDPVKRAAVEQAMRDDPELAAAVERHRALRRDVAGAFAAILDEPVPERLQPDMTARVVQLNAARARRLQPPAPPAQPPRRRWSWPEWGALAATLVLGILLGQNGPGGGVEPTIGGDGGTLTAHGELAQALDQQPGGARTGVAQVGISFAARDGSYCRGFVYGPSAGLACRHGDAWRIPVLAESPSQAEGSYRQAGSALPPAVLDAIDARIAGAPLDAAGEAAARSRGWQAQSPSR